MTARCRGCSAVQKYLLVKKVPLTTPPPPPPKFQLVKVPVPVTPVAQVPVVPAVPAAPNVPVPVTPVSGATVSGTPTTTPSPTFTPAPTVPAAGPVAAPTGNHCDDRDDCYMILTLLKGLSNVFLQYGCTGVVSLQYVGADTWW